MVQWQVLVNAVMDSRLHESEEFLDLLRDYKLI